MITDVRCYYDEEKENVLAPCFAHTSCVDKYTENNPKATNENYTMYLKPLIDDMLTRGYGLELSDLRDFMSNKMPGV